MIVTLTLVLTFLIPVVAADPPKRATRKPLQTTGLKLQANTFYNARIDPTPDVNQHMTYEQWLQQIPARQRARYTPPAEIGIKSKVFQENFCGPCSVADNLIYLRKWFPQVRPEGNDLVAGTLLARNLGMSYMETYRDDDPEDFDPATGTGTSYKKLIDGTLSYLADKGIKAKKVTLIGYRAHASERSEYGHPGTNIELHQRAPKLEEVRQALHLRAVVVQHYGHYDYKNVRFNKDGKAEIRQYLQRAGGHYVAPVGYGLNKSGKPDPDMMIYHDPAGASQDKKAQDYRKWLRQPKGPWQDLMLVNFRGDKTIRHKDLYDPNWPRYEVYGSLIGTCVRDAAIDGPKQGQRYEVLEGLIVIEL